MYQYSNHHILISFIVPLVAIFTKCDGQIIQESLKLDDLNDSGVKWDKARENANVTFQRIYLPRVLHTLHPPKAYVQLQGEESEHFYWR